MNQDKKLEKIRHTLAHLLAAVVLEKYPHAKLAIGPAINNGFYYDIDFSEGSTPGDNDLKELQKLMKKSLNKWQSWEHEIVTPEKARTIFKDNPYKLELIEEISNKKENITLYTCGGFTDLCRGGHTDNPQADIATDAFKLDKIAGAYWRGDENNKMLTRIYGLAFVTKEDLKAYEEKIQKAKDCDHRKLGKELDLFTFSDLVGPGLPLFTPRGTLLRNLITEKIDNIQKQYGYQKVTIPHITKKDLYQTSGHWQKFGDELFKVRGKNDAEFVMKPMNCPHHTQIFASQMRSYKNLPLRYAETTMVYRDEQAGELLGLSRVRSITQDDGHVFCAPEQIETEIKNIVQVIETFYSSLNLYDKGKFWVSLSVSDPKEPEKYLGNKKIWQLAENTLETVAQKLNLPYQRVEGEASFYGPKLDFMFKDALDREWQLATAQLDFVMPERFGLEYTDRDGKKQTPVMIHRAIAGSLERFLSIMIEHFAGAFPFWLAPEQIAIIPVREEHNAYAEKVAEILRQQNFRVELYRQKENMGRKIRQAKKMKIPYFIVIGDKEVTENNLTLESRDHDKTETLKINELVEKLKTN